MASFVREALSITGLLVFFALLSQIGATIFLDALVVIYTITALITTIIWGFQTIVIKLATNLIDAVTIAWFRFVLAFSLLFIFYSFKKPSYLKILKKPPFYLVIAALGLTINYLTSKPYLLYKFNI